MRRSSLRLSVVLCSTVAMLAACHGSSSSSTQAPSPSGGGNAAAANRAPAKPAAVTPANIALGDSLFNNGGCANCHGKMGVGGPNAPALTGKTWLQLKTGSFEEIAGIITSGVPVANIKDPTHKRAMGARGGRAALTDPQITAVAAYVYTLTHK